MSTPRALRGCVAAVMILGSGQLVRAQPGGLEPTAPVTDPLEPPPGAAPLEPPPGAEPLEPPPGGDEPGLALDSPDLAAPPAASGSAEPGAGGIVVGGTLDYRVFVPSDMTQGMYEIHVNELFVTTNIGDHIAILAEQLLLTSELVSNVVQHAHTAFELVIDITERIIRVEIHDRAAVTDAFRALVNSPPTAVDVTSVSGRGLGLVRSTAINCGLIDKGICGKAVWFELVLNGE